jgi:hypothetical protein
MGRVELSFPRVEIGKLLRPSFLKQHSSLAAPAAILAPPRLS